MTQEEDRTPGMPWNCTQRAMEAHKLRVQITVLMLSSWATHKSLSHKAFVSSSIYMTH